MEAEVSRTWENYYQHKSREITRAWATGAVIAKRLEQEDIAEIPGVSKLECIVRHFTQRYLAGEEDVRQYIWGLVLPVMIGRALRMGIAETEFAAEVAADAMLYAQGYAERNAADVKSLMALFNNSVSLHVMKKKDNRDWDPEIPEGDLALPMEASYSGDEEEDPEPLVSIECAEWGKGRFPHPYLTAVTLTTPEDIVVAENLREYLERTAIETCGQEAWSIYYAAIVQEQPQVSIAEARGVSPATISRTVRTVGEALKAALLGTS